MSHKKAIILTCGIALLWSLAGWNIKMITWSPYAIAAGRSIISVVLLLPMVLKGKSLHISRNVIGGAVCYTIFNYCFIISTKLATSAIAIMMQYTAPVYVAVLAWIFKGANHESRSYQHCLYIRRNVPLLYRRSRRRQYRRQDHRCV